MNKSFFQKKERIPQFLVPKVRKRHVPPIYKDSETEWRLFAEGALRNKVFHEDVLNRGSKCLACGQSLIHGKTKYLRIEKHHYCYLRLCTGNILPGDSSDIYRAAKNAEFAQVPDCRNCKANNPDYYKGCIKKIFPVHGRCHGHIHEVEKDLFNRVGKKLSNDFIGARFNSHKIQKTHKNSYPQSVAACVAFRNATLNIQFFLQPFARN